MDIIHFLFYESPAARSVLKKNVLKDPQLLEVFKKNVLKESGLLRECLWLRAILNRFAIRKRDKSLTTFYYNYP